MSTTIIRVLVVEDNPGDARLVREYLAQANGATFELECVGRLAAALERLSRGGMDVILTDLQLPDSVGLETFQQLHAQAPSTAIVLLTGTIAEAHIATQALQQGAQDFLEKGTISANDLSRALRYAVERTRAEAALRAAHDALQLKIGELETLNNIMLDREERILELKDALKVLQSQRTGT